MDLGDHGSYIVAGSSRYLLSALLLDSCSLTTFKHVAYTYPWADGGWWEEKSHWANLPHAHLQPVTAVSSQPLQAKNMPLR